MNTRLVVEILIGLGLIIAAGFAFVQTQNLTNTEATLEAAQAAGTEVGQVATDQAEQSTVAAEAAAATSTQAAANLDDAQASATQSALEAADEQATLQAEAEAAQATLQAEGTQAAEEAAQELESAQGTATSAAESAAADATESGERLDDAQATATQSAQEAADAQATLEAQSTTAAENAEGTSTAAAEAADATSTQAALAFADVAATATSGAARAEARATQAANDLAAIEAFSATQGAELDAANASSDSLQATIDANVDISGEGVIGESATLPETYIRFRGENFELGLPERFDGAELSGNTFSFFALLSSLDLNETTSYLREQGEQLIFFGIDTELVDGLPGATVSVIREAPLATDLALQEYLALAYDPLPEGYSLVARDVVSVNGRPAGRVILNGQLIAGDVFVIQYIFPVAGDFWLVTYSGPAGNFETLRPVIEESIQTFRVR